MVLQVTITCLIPFLMCFGREHLEMIGTGFVKHDASLVTQPVVSEQLRGIQSTDPHPGKSSIGLILC